MTAVASAVLDHHPARWRVLALLASAELLGMSLWFAGSAVAPQLAQRWSIDSTQAAWLTTIVQLGFVCGTGVAALTAVSSLAVGADARAIVDCT